MEVVLAPAQPDGLHAAFGPKEPCGFGDRRFSTPSLLNGGDLFYGYPSPSSPFGLGRVLSRGSSDSGSVVDEGNDAAAAAERRQRLARLALQYQEVVTCFEVCLSYLADTSNEAAALRRENDELRIANEDLAKLVDEFSKLSLTKDHPIPLRPLTPLPANEEHLRPSKRTPLKIKNARL